MTQGNHLTEHTHWTSTDVMRPTQCTVGYLEVEYKMRELRARAHKPEALKKYLLGHPLPAVRGPDQRLYLTDHHHMGLALLRLCEEWDDSAQAAADNPYRSCCFLVVHDWSARAGLSMPGFYALLQSHQLSHPRDAQGKPVDRLPRSLYELADDAYRSLAGLARKAGAYNKVDVPFTEFLWADFLRDKVAAHGICEAHIDQAILQTLKIAHSQSAAALPGWIGARDASALPSLEQIRARLEQRHGADDAAPDLPPVTGAPAAHGHAGVERTAT